MREGSVKPTITLMNGMIKERRNRVYMKVIMYGTEICPDCVKAKEILKARPDIELDYKDITKSTATLKEFLAYRDFDEMFKPIIQERKIGIPFFILEDNTKTFDIYEYLNLEKKEPKANSCSIDGKGNC